MATLKIYQPQITPKQNANTPQISALQIDQGYAQMTGNAFKKLGKEIEDIYFEQKAEEDANEAQDIIDEINPVISQNFSTYSKSRNIKDGVGNFSKTLDPSNYKNLLEGKNKNVQRYVTKYLRKQKSKLGLQLGNKIIANSIEASKENKQGYLNALINDLSSDNVAIRSIANKEYETFFTDVKNIDFYGAKGLNELRKKSDEQIFTLQLINRTKNGQLDLTKDSNRSQILAAFPDKTKAKAILNKVRTIQAGEQFKKRKEIEFNQKKTIQGQINNFASILNAVVANRRLDNDETRTNLPDIDTLNDMKNEGTINDAQYEYLLRVYTDKEFNPTDEFMTDTVNIQLAIAESVEDIEDIQNGLMFDKRLQNKYSPEQLIQNHQLLEKFKEDRNYQKEFKKYLNFIEIHTESISRYKLSNKSSDKKEMFAENKIAEFKKLSLEVGPEKAYLQVIDDLKKGELPQLESLPIRSELSLLNQKAFFQDNNKDGFELLRGKAADLFKKSKNIEQYKTDIKNISVIEDVFKIRKEIYGNIDEALGTGIKPRNLEEKKS